MSETRPRPLRVTLFAWIVLGLSAWNALRLVETLLFWRVLTEYGAQPGPVYMAARGAFWLAFGLGLTAGMLRGSRWAWPAAAAFTLGYGLWHWLDRLLAQDPTPAWPFALGLTFILMSLAAFILLSPRTLRYFHREPHERKSETPAAS